MIQAPFIWIALSFTAGILLQPFYFRGLVWPFLLSVAAGLFFLKGRKLFGVFLCAGFVLLGMVNADLDRNPVPTSLKKEIEKQGVENFFAVIGKVSTEPESKIHGRKQSVSFIFESSSVVRWEKQKASPRRNARGKIQVFMNQPDRKSVV